MKIAALLSCLCLLVSTAVAADKPVKVEKEWKAMSVAKADNDLWKKVPPGGVITSQKEWAALWKAWFGDAEVPKVDFEEEFVLVAAGQGPNILKVEGLVLTEKGDLRFNWSVTERGGDGFVGTVIKVKKHGVKTVNGKAPPEV
jgi:hypothetical protein